MKSSTNKKININKIKWIENKEFSKYAFSKLNSAVASATIDTYAGATKAFAQGGVAGFLTSAAVIVAGLANVRKILSTKIKGNGGGGGGNAPTPTNTPAPRLVSGNFELGGTTDIEPQRAYVVSDDITNNQNKLANIRRRATI